MKAIVVSAVMVASMLTCIGTAYCMNALFWLSLAVLAATCVYSNRHQKELIAELEEIFGRDEELR